jgi:hypothetical protein
MPICRIWLLHVIPPRRFASVLDRGQQHADQDPDDRDDDQDLDQRKTADRKCVLMTRLATAVHSVPFSNFDQLIVEAFFRPRA